MLYTEHNDTDFYLNTPVALVSYTDVAPGRRWGSGFQL